MPQRDGDLQLVHGGLAVSPDSVRHLRLVPRPALTELRARVENAARELAALFPYVDLDPAPGRACQCAYHLHLAALVALVDAVTDLEHHEANPNTPQPR